MLPSIQDKQKCGIDIFLMPSMMVNTLPKATTKQCAEKQEVITRTIFNP